MQPLVAWYRDNGVTPRFELVPGLYDAKLGGELARLGFLQSAGWQMPDPRGFKANVPRPPTAQKGLTWSDRMAPAHELGPASKLALSTSSDAFLRYLAIFSSGSVSAFSVPQLLTIFDAGTFALTGYSLLAEA